MKVFDLTVTWSVQLTEEDVDYIMCAALEGGITYWCRKVEVVGEYIHEWAHEQISAGGTLRFYDAESDEVWELNIEKFLAGFRLWLQDSGCERIMDNRIDTSDIDANEADCIIQYALFGEQVFA